MQPVEAPVRRRAAPAETSLDQVSKWEGVVSLPSGVRYRVLKEGNDSGRSPKASDTVVVNYQGTLPVGREIGRSQAATWFEMDELMPGWQEAWRKIEPGAEWELYLPPSHAKRGSTRRVRCATAYRSS